ncbi:MAG: PadR family transcriptional regulator [Candidatus Latescibacteria bacterium]|nr:PadR family transcriptional regulator [Candidatus Latescibacterota bacterium]
MNIDKELIGASTGLLILGIIAKSASYGYKIIKQINEDSEGLFHWQEGTVYPILHKLENEGLIRSQWETADTGRKRKFYYITSKGREAITETKHQWNECYNLILRVVEVPNA